jgi:hypothetical protein
MCGAITFGACAVPLPNIFSCLCAVSPNRFAKVEIHRQCKCQLCTTTLRLKSVLFSAKGESAVWMLVIAFPFLSTLFILTMIAWCVTLQEARRSDLHAIRVARQEWR